ncbi:MAG TPA: GNAT family N-acetyltransferase [Acidobacteriaceae bacterium]|nr:GNAT family N-acetyltransferase [Acidobacteriaceae bacterium]
MTSRDVPVPAEGVVIRRAELDDIEAVLQSVSGLAESSGTAACWSRAAFYPYVAIGEDSSALQARSMFLAWAYPSAAVTTTSEGEHTISSVNRVVGFAAFSSIMTVGGGESTLENMVVATSRQRQGIGQRLLAAGLLWCRAHASGTVFLEVRKSNLAAIALYERVGFTAVGNRPGYYRDPAEDGLQMQKILNPVGHAG